MRATTAPPRPTPAPPFLPAANARASNDGRPPAAPALPPTARRGTVSMPRGWRPELEPGLNARFRVPFELTGAEGAPLLVLLGGISADRHVCANLADPSAGWWRRIVGPGLAIDPSRWRVLGIDFIGAPGTIDPLGDHGGRARFNVTPGDQADAVAAVLDHLGEERAHRVVGASYGGNVALALGIRHAERADGVVLVAAAHRPHPLATGVRGAQRAIMELGRDHGREADAVAIARALAFTTYKTAAGLDARFDFAADVSEGRPAHPVDGYLLSRGRAFAERFDARAYLTLSGSIDLCDLRPEELTLPSWLISWEEDGLVPLWLVEEAHRRAGARSTLRVLRSAAGHDAFLLADPAYAEALREACAPAANGPGDATRDEGGEGHIGVGGAPGTARRREPARPTRTRGTELVRAGVGDDPAHGAVMPPVHLSSNFRFRALGDAPKYDYTRSGNPTRDHLASALARLEGGAGAVATSSGMSAVAVVLNLLRADDLVLAPHDCYGGTHRLLTGLRRQGRLRVRFVDFTNPASLAAGLEAAPRMIWVETPSNPLLRITDLATVAREARRVGAIAVADNTFLSPALQRPLDFGFDVVVHSTTKFINGHSDVVGGAVVAADDALVEEIAWWTNAAGTAQSPFDSYLALRGARTLFARTRVHEENARAVVNLLASHPAVARVCHPGLATHPGHRIARRQQSGYGSLLSVELEGGRPAAEALLSRLRLFTLAESLGGVESLVCHPATMTHAAMDAAAQAVAGIGEGLLRISVGIESADDLVADLEQALPGGRAKAHLGAAGRG